MDPSEYAKAFRDGELSALDEFVDRLKARLEELQGQDHWPGHRRASDITAATAATIKEMRKERE